MIPAAVLAVGAAEDPAEEPEEAGAEELEEQAGVEARHLQGDPGEILGPHRPQVAPLLQNRPTKNIEFFNFRSSNVDFVLQFTYQTRC